MNDRQLGRPALCHRSRNRLVNYDDRRVRFLNECKGSPLSSNSKSMVMAP